MLSLIMCVFVLWGGKEEESQAQTGEQNNEFSKEMSDSLLKKH